MKFKDYDLVKIKGIKGLYTLSINNNYIVIRDINKMSCFETYPKAFRLFDNIELIERPKIKKQKIVLYQIRYFDEFEQKETVCFNQSKEKKDLIVNELKKHKRKFRISASTNYILKIEYKNFEKFNREKYL